MKTFVEQFPGRPGQPGAAESRKGDGPRALRDDALDRQLKELSKLTLWKGLAAVTFDWAIMSAAFVAALQFPHVLVWVAAFIVIAARQHGLLILMHDASHFRLLPNRRWNDRLSNWLLAWPLFVTTEGYRANHLAHHRYLNTDDDPDWTRKSGRAEWTFPKTKGQVLRLLARDFFGGGALDAIRSILDLSGGEAPAATKRNTARSLERLAYYVVAAALISWFGLWLPVLLLWFLPAFTLLMVILRIRSIAEHFGVEGEHELNMSRNTHVRWWERFLLAPHQCGYHLDHHLFPSVPFYNLPRLQEVLAAMPAYAETSHQSHGFFGRSESSFLQEITAHD